MRSFTLIELIMVVIIIAVLSSIGFMSYNSQKESAYLKEATTNLNLIASAEKIFRLETNSYVICNTTAEVNNILRLSLSTSAPVRWNYKVNPADNTTFTGKAGYQPNNNATVWCINETVEKPFNGTDCTW